MKKISYLLAAATIMGISLHAEMPSEPAAAPAAAPAPAAMASVKVEGIEIAKGVEAREPMEPASSFDSTVERVYCWTKISSDNVPTSIKHVWSVNGEKMAEVPLNIANSPARTWSYKTVWPGSWKVEVTDPAGNVLTSREFTVAEKAVESGQGAPPPPTDLHQSAPVSTKPETK